MTPDERREAAEERARLKQLEQREAAARKAAVPAALLAKSAQAGLNYIMEQQHSGGGWRYNPGQAGDSSVGSWMMQSLKRGDAAKLRVVKGTVSNYGKFLDSVQRDKDGAVYDYMADKSTPIADIRNTRLMGLLCRLYLGWDRNHPGVVKGIEQLDKWGPSIGRSNTYYNYYGTHLMFYYGGEPWQKWNTRLRDYLVESQSKNGHEQGSWFFDIDGNTGQTHGGRLAITTLTALTLQIYYRHDRFGQPK
jgi:hypothetical protein